MTKFLLFGDLLRTLIPNEEQSESPKVREFSSSFMKSLDGKLAYVSGPGHKLIQDAIEGYQLPIPDFHLILIPQLQKCAKAGKESVK